MQTLRIWARSTCLPVRDEEQVMLDGDCRLAAFNAATHTAATCYIVHYHHHQVIWRFPSENSQKKKKKKKTRF